MRRTMENTQLGLRESARTEGKFSAIRNWTGVWKWENACLRFREIDF